LILSGGLKMKKALLFLIVLAILPTQAFSADPNAAAKTKVVETKGQGVNRDEAINMALKQAVAQVKGLSLARNGAKTAITNKNAIKTRQTTLSLLLTNSRATISP
jgi:hypothetical protein